MANDYFTPSGSPATSSAGASSVMRSEFTAIEAGFDKLPDLTTVANRVVHVNAGSTALITTSGFTFDGTALTAPAYATLTLSNGGALRTTTTAGNTALIQAYDTDTGPAYVTFGTLTAGTAPSFELDNTILDTAVAKGAWTASGTWTVPAVTLGGTVSGGGNQINNVVIGAVTPLAGSFSTVTTDTIVSSGTTATVFNTVATTVNAFAAATVLAIAAAASATTWTGQSFAMTGANSTNNTTMSVTNTSNAAAASHSILDVSVGGTTSTGDPQVRFTIPGGTSWYEGVDNSNSDGWALGTGTAVGASTILTITTGGQATLSSGALAFAGTTAAAGTVRWVGGTASGTYLNSPTGESVRIGINNTDQVTVGATSVTLANNLVVSGTGPHAIGGATAAYYSLLIRGAFAGDASGAFGVGMAHTLSPQASMDSYGLQVAPVFNEAASGTHVLFAGAYFSTPVINGGAAALTSASTVCIQGAPTGATNNYALWVDAGNFRWDGDLIGGIAGDNTIRLNTADASDNGGLYLVAGGAVSASRGASVLMYGNEHANTGVLQLGAGDVTNGVIRLLTAGAEQLRIRRIASAVNWLEISGGITGNTPVISVEGETNISLTYTTKGTGDHYFYTNNSGTLQFVLANTAGASRIPAGLRVGADSTNNLLDDATNGAGTAALWIGNAQITAVSDIRLKANIVDTQRDALGIFGKLRVVDHTWNDPNDNQGENNRNARGVWTGLIAQEADEHIPWIVNRPRKPEHGDFMWQMDYNYMAPLFVRGFQQVDEKIGALVAENVALKQQLLRLENRA